MRPAAARPAAPPAAADGAPADLSALPAASPGGAAADLGPFARHDLVWLDPAIPPAAAAGGEEDFGLIVAWAAAGRPFVVRRDEGRGPLASAADRPALALGLPLPTHLGRRRLAFAAPRAAVLRRGPMPLLAEAAAEAPESWRAPIDALDAALAACGATTRCYGSLAWQHLTGEAYLRPRSDLDLLIAPGADLARALACLGAVADTNAPRFDGEILLAADRAVAWRELASDAREVLVRGLDTLALMPRDEALALGAQGGRP